MSTFRGELQFRYHWSGEGKWLDIAEISGDSQTSQHVIALMEQHEIPFGCGGSKTYNCYVPPEHENEAIAILLADSSRYGYWIMFYRLERGGEAYFPVAVVQSEQASYLGEVLAANGWKAFCGDCRSYTPIYATQESAEIVVHWLRTNAEQSGQYLGVL